jgi:hypothetical protein
MVHVARGYSCPGYQQNVKAFLGWKSFSQKQIN